MREDVLETLVASAIELLEVVVYLGGSIGLSGLGILAEQFGVGQLAAEHTLLGLWGIFYGALLLFAGLYLVGYRHLLPTVSRSVGRSFE